MTAFVPRLNAAERAVFNERAKHVRGRKTVQAGEPAMGTLEERLDIIIRRLGGTAGPVRMSQKERAQYARYLQPETIEEAS